MFHLRLGKDIYYGSEDDPIVTACLVVDGGDPLDHVVYFVIETIGNDTAGKFTVCRNEYILLYISPDQLPVWTMKEGGVFTGLEMVPIKNVLISQF